MSDVTITLVVCCSNAPYQSMLSAWADLGSNFVPPHTTDDGGIICSRIVQPAVHNLFLVEGFRWNLQQIFIAWMGRIEKVFKVWGQSHSRWSPIHGNLRYRPIYRHSWTKLATIADKTSKQTNRHTRGILIKTLIATNIRYAIGKKWKRKSLGQGQGHSESTYCI